MATHLQGTQPVLPPTAHPLAGSLRKVEPKRLSLSLLIALVIGSMIGSGIFSLPQNMAASAGAGAILIGWLITGVGMLSLALVYQTLSNRQPALDNGVFAYARALGGEYLSFNSAWGYWISAWIGNVSYLVILFAALSYFFPLGQGRKKEGLSPQRASLRLLRAGAQLAQGCRCREDRREFQQGRAEHLAAEKARSHESG